MTAVTLRLEEAREKEGSSHPIVIDPEIPHMLTQVRQTYAPEDTLELALSILRKGQLVRGILVALTKPEALSYVEFFNEVFGTTHSIVECAPAVIDGDTFYIFVVAGHRRLLACRMLNKDQCAGTVAFSPHYGGMYRAELCFGMSGEEAFLTQFHENTHRRPSPFEEAQAVWGYWQREEAHGRRPSVSMLARKMGRGKDWVRGALQFAVLPKSIRDLADPKAQGSKLAYGLVVEIARLAHGLREITGAMPDEASLHRIAGNMLLEGWGTKRAYAWVSAYLKEARFQAEGQQSLFGSEGAGSDMRRPRDVFEPTLVKFTLAMIQLVRQVARHDARGGFGGESPFSPDERGTHSARSPLRSLGEFCRLAEELEPRLLALSQREGRGVGALREGMIDLGNLARAVCGEKTDAT